MYRVRLGQREGREERVVATVELIDFSEVLGLIIRIFLAYNGVGKGQKALLCR
jgi:hypothetical protein